MEIMNEEHIEHYFTLEFGTYTRIGDSGAVIVDGIAAGALRLPLASSPLLPAIPNNSSHSCNY